MVLSDPNHGQSYDGAIGQSAIYEVVYRPRCSFRSFERILIIHNQNFERIYVYHTLLNK